MSFDSSRTARRLRVKPSGAPIAYRRRLPEERSAVTHRFAISGSKGYLTVGEYEDGTLGELFIRFGEEAGVIDEDRIREILASRNALMDQFAIAVSLLLQVGVTVKALVDKFRYTKFPPQGFTGNSDVPNATSPIDYVFGWIAKRYLSGEAVAVEVPPVAQEPSDVETRVVPEATPVEVPTGVRVSALDGFIRCPGDGENGCGHAKHVGQCRSNAYSLHPCQCKGTP
jgi:ribonucleoside-diphosphate reductase alpha chain